MQWKRKEAVFALWGSSVVMGTLIGTLFLQLGDDYDDMFARQALLNMVNTIVVVGVATVTSSIMSDRNVMYANPLT